VKVGIGPGSICTTRIVAGVGIPQVTAIQNVALALEKGGRTAHCRRRRALFGDIAKAIAAGADTVMLGASSPARRNRPARSSCSRAALQIYRGMGSLRRCSRARRPLFPGLLGARGQAGSEGVEGRVPYKGS